MDAGRPTAEKTQQAFHPRVKDIALKILLDYRQETGKGWTVIRREIIENAGLLIDDSRLTRQDLEGWAARRTSLGDQKFRLVYAYLTSAAVKSRPEFAGAAALTDPFAETLRAGRVFAQLFGRTTTKFGKGRRRSIDALSGTWSGTALDGSTVFLIITRVDSEEFSLFQVLRRPPGHEVRDYDLGAFVAFRGFATFGKVAMLHGARLDDATWRSTVFTTEGSDAVRNLDPDAKIILLHELTAEKLLTNHDQKLEQSDLIPSSIVVLSRYKEWDFSWIVDQMEWSVPL